MKCYPPLLCYHYIWGIAYKILLSDDLHEEPEYPPNHDFHGGHHLESRPSQLSATSDSPVKT